MDGRLIQSENVNFCPLWLLEFKKGDTGLVLYGCY